MKLTTVILKQHNISLQKVLLLHTEGSKREYRKMLHCKSHERLPESRSKNCRNVSWWKLDLLLYQFLVRLHNGSFYLFLIKTKHFNKCLFGQEYSPSREIKLILVLLIIN